MIKYVAIIPARGGSKGVPKKNIKKFLDKPLLEHSIEYAKNCDYIDQIILTTDDLKIKKIGEKYNITIVDRPSKISGDTATTESAIKHIIETINFSENTVFVLLQPTSPLRPKKSLEKMIELFNKNQYDSLLTISPIHPLTWKIESNNLNCMYNYKNRPRRQDFKKNDLIYDENGSVYLFTLSLFKKENNRLGGNIGYFVFEEEYGKQIDTELDFKILESIGKHLNN